MNPYSYEEEMAWRKSRELAWEIFGVTAASDFGGDGQLKNEIRTASFAIMGNLAEGFERGLVPEFSHYLTTAKQHLARLGQQMQAVERAKYLEQVLCHRINFLVEDLGFLVSSLMTHVHASRISLDVESEVLEEV
ncbi:MAG: four helix bundle protein [Gammaproteobacteria bacterium]|nr:four helix bundle protein [Gammaproteobacteria bacterium]